MTYGLRIWDASGKLSLDITDRFPKIYAALYVTLGASTNNVISLPGYEPSDFLIDTAFRVSEETSGSFKLTNFINGPKSAYVFVFKG